MKVKELFEDRDRQINISDKSLVDGHLKIEFYSGKSFNGIFICSNLQLKDLKNSPVDCLEFNCNDNDFLTSLEGGPTEVTQFFDCSNCINLTSLQGAPERIYEGSFDFENTAVTSLEGIGIDYLKEVNATIWFSKTLKSNVLGLLKVKHLSKFDTVQTIPQELTNLKEIINRHLKLGRRLSKCKQELIEAGLKEYAKL
jgi:hypothetical protein